ncbi:MAG: phage baseplate assembly protein V [Rhodobacteraceae bacterium]|nr:phage baseplate assembly protein V [Paracoccaceae bacterium]
MSFETAELDRRVANIVQMGRVIEIDSAAMRARVQIGDLVTPMIPVAQLASGQIKLHWMPSAGEQVVVYAPSGEVGAAFVQGSVPQNGSAVAQDASHPTIDLGGGTLVITGDVTITGNITVTGRIDVTEDVTATGISLVDHIHPESVGILTGPPQ